MAGKGGKGLLAGQTPASAAAANKDKDKKRPISRSSRAGLQFCRYLFYLSKIRTIQLEYTDAKESLLQAARKAPVAALGFRVQCNKWGVMASCCILKKNLGWK